MNLTERIEKPQEFLNDLINKCWEDESFKQELISNPVETIKKLGASVNPDRKIVVNDQTDYSVLNINIPAKPHFEDLELTDKELEAVAGGAADSGWFNSIGICIDIKIEK